MNLKKNSFLMLGLVCGVSVILYVFDAHMISPFSKTVPTVPSPTELIVFPTEQVFRKSYSETVNYAAKGRDEYITVALTLEGDIVSQIHLTQKSKNTESARYQSEFAKEIQQYVVGKNIKDINVSRIAGASYTTQAFMLAIQKIQNSI